MEDIQAGRAAQELLDNPTFETVINELLQEQWLMFLATDPEQKTEREKIHSYVSAIDGIRTKLKNRVSYMNDLLAEDYDG